MIDEKKKQYIIKRIKEKFGDIEADDFKDFIKNLDDFKDIKYIIIENYNLPEFYWRIYDKDVGYLWIIEDYFSDTETALHDLCDNGIIYDVKKDKFVIVEIGVKFTEEE